MKVVPYYPISDGIMRLIVRLKVNKIAKRLKENRNVLFSYDEGLIDHIAGRCTEVDSGARNVDHILTNTLLPQISREILSRMTTGAEFKEIKVSMNGEGFGFEVV